MQDTDDLPEMPEMTKAEVLFRVRQWTGGKEIAEIDYPEMVRLLTVAGYLTDLCVAEIERRDLLTYLDDMPIVPDARPNGMHVPGGLTQIGGYAS